MHESRQANGPLGLNLPTALLGLTTETVANFLERLLEFRELGR